MATEQTSTLSNNEAGQRTEAERRIARQHGRGRAVVELRGDEAKEAALTEIR